MKEIDVDLAQEILKKYDEILLLCGAKEEELISTAFNSFSHELEAEVVKSELLKDKSKEEKHVVAEKLRDTVVEDMLLLIGSSLAKCLQAVGTSLTAASKDKQAIKKSADEWFNKTFHK